MPVIKGVDLEIADKEFVVFVGPSGCGKSTMLRLIAGLEESTEGTILLNDEDVTSLTASERGLAMVFQSYALYPHKTVRDNMAFPLRVAGMSRAAAHGEVDKAAQVLQLTALLDRKPKELSGGQRQRVAIGRCIVRNPKAFLFDEPLSNLDAALRVEMRVQIAKLHRQLDATMIYVTHDQVEAMTMADKIAVLRDGRVEQFGAPLELYNRPANKFVAGFIGTPRMNFLEVEKAESGKIALPGGQELAPPKGWTWEVPRATLGVRAHHLEVGQGGGLALTATAIEQLGGETYVYGEVEGHAFTLHLQGQAQVEIGEVLHLTPKADQIHLFAE